MLLSRLSAGLAVLIASVLPGCDSDGDQRATGSIGQSTTGAGSGEGSEGSDESGTAPRDPAPLDAVCFTPAVSVPWVGPPPLDFGDVTGDGVADVVVTAMEQGKRVATVLLGTAGEDRWATSVKTEIASGDAERIADATGDGVADLLVVGSALTVYAGTETGDFVQTDYATPLSTFRSFALVDFNRDGAVDLLTAGFEEELEAHRSMGDGRFELVSSIAITAPMGSAEVYADRSGAAAAGLIVGTAAGCLQCEESAFSLLRIAQDGTVTPTAVITWASTWSMILTTVGQLFAGGTPEVIVDFGTDQRTVFNQTMGRLDIGAYLPNGPLDFGDINGDGQAELVLHDETRLGVYTDGGDAPVRVIDVAAPAAPELHVTDLDGDGWADVVLLDPVNYNSDTGLPEPVAHLLLSVPC